MRETYLVTGATGFIGANLVKALVSSNKKVSILTRNKKLNWRLLPFKSHLNIHECDLLDKKLSKTIEQIRPDYIFHLASFGVLPAQEDFKRIYETNFLGTVNLIEALKQNPFKILINSGSATEYGLSDTPMKEGDILKPINDYSVSKASTTLYCQKERMRNNLPIVTLRLFTPFGYMEEASRLTPSIILSIINKKNIKVSSPSYVRDFIFIDDVIDAYLSMASVKSLPTDGIINIGSGKQHSVKEVVDALLKISRSKVEVEWGAVPAQARQIETSNWVADISLAKKYGWQPKISFENGLSDTYNWFLANKKLYKANV